MNVGDIERGTIVYSKIFMWGPGKVKTILPRTVPFRECGSTKRKGIVIQWQHGITEEIAVNLRRTPKKGEKA